MKRGSPAGGAGPSSGKRGTPRTRRAPCPVSRYGHFASSGSDSDDPPEVPEQEEKDEQEEKEEQEEEEEEQQEDEATVMPRCHRGWTLRCTTGAG